jgi:nucleotide-binding universal stress UspA family protein
MAKEAPMYSRILVPLDGSKTAEKALPYARTLARRFALPVKLLVVVDIAELATHLSAANARYMDAMVESELKKSSEYLSGIVKTFKDTAATYAVEKGRADEVIIEGAASEKQTLITMATHGRSGLHRWLLGSVAEKVLRATANPLLLVRAAGDTGSIGDVNLTSLVVALDGSELAETALPAAVEMAGTLNLEMILLRAYELPVSAYYGTGNYIAGYEDLKERVKEEAVNYLDGKVASVKAKGLQRVVSKVMEGPGAEEIIEYARGRAGALVAMCTHGRSGMSRWMLGSVTEKVVRHCGGPVLVISAKGDAKAADRAIAGKLGEEVSEAMRYTID